MTNLKLDMKVYLQPAFLICTAVLAIAGGGMSLAIKGFGLYLEKEPLPLKKPLQLLDEGLLSPYRVIPNGRLPIENEQILKELGTKDYIQWVLEDADEPVDSPVRRCLLFITYYGLPDRVPHVPEECYTGSGFQRFATDSVTLEIDKPDFRNKIQARYLVFARAGSDFWQNSEKFPVVYFFRVNSEYAGGRDEVRVALNKNLFGKYSYFSKIELAFNRTLAAPTQKQVIKAGEKILGIILPVLEKEHWPITDKRAVYDEKAE